VWAAAGAARLRLESGASSADLPITLVSPGDGLVVRPRLYQADPGSMSVPLDSLLTPIDVARIPGAVTSIDPAGHRVRAWQRDGRESTLVYDRLVLASGSQITRPRLPGLQTVFDVDSLPGAVELEDHLLALPAADGGAERYTAVVIGAGFTGIELATELVGRLRDIAGPNQPVRVVLVERAAVVGPELGDAPRPIIEAALQELGIELRLGVSLRAASSEGATLSDGTSIAARTVVWTAGMTASPLTAQIPGRRDSLGRLIVDADLRVIGAPEVFAAGDVAAAIAREGRAVVQSCQHAMPLGRSAGHNAAADLLGVALVPYESSPYGTCLDLGAAGAVLTTGWDRAVRASGKDAKQRKRWINEVAIYPPQGDADALLALASPHPAPLRAG
jgi:NADH dehydrogenase